MNFLFTIVEKKYKMTDSEKMSKPVYALIEIKFRKDIEKIKYKFLFEYTNNFYNKNNI